ncbi:Hypothetical protein FKW44_011861 [Caligus rogercresseyi]|uniref:Uncharacterized protein n=1 Tax=Caligus rogercresseyi TaxID=217165 RepID=A0A7T8K9Z6_CALRO|nr:Hypothetical protein FKW44_011861 [Caligus rogercresseyi]
MWCAIIYAIQVYRDREYRPQFTSRRIDAAYKEAVMITQVHELPMGFEWDQELMIPALGSARTYVYRSNQIIVPNLSSFQAENLRFLRELDNFTTLATNRGRILLPKQANGLNLPEGGILSKIKGAKDKTSDKTARTGPVAKKPTGGAPRRPRDKQPPEDKTEDDAEEEEEDDDAEEEQEEEEHPDADGEATQEEESPRRRPLSKHPQKRNRSPRS